MGERKGQNKYYPPDFDYKVHKSLSGYHGQHALRERARKLDQGILIIRFEMPYNIWCDKCNSHIGMGVRYNAEKSKIGNYYSTPIFKFRMKCHLCDNHFEIKTDPQNHDYVIISGARRKEQRWDPHENEQIVPEDRDNQKKLALDSMYKLEHSSNDQAKGAASAPRLAQIIEHCSAYRDDFSLNQLARKQFREAKKARKLSSAKDEELKKRLSLSLDLLPESEKDLQVAKFMMLSSVKSLKDGQREVQTRIRERPVFGSQDAGPNSSTPKASSLKILQRVATSDIMKRRNEAFSLNEKGPNKEEILSKQRKCNEGSEVISENRNTHSTASNVTPVSLPTNGNGLKKLMEIYEESSASSDTD